jgi:hypothetical protein
MAFIAADIKHIFVLKPPYLHQLHPWILLEGLPNPISIVAVIIAIGEDNFALLP